MKKYQLISRLKSFPPKAKEENLNAQYLLSLVKKYVEITELNAEIIRQFVDRIIVFKTEKVNGHRQQRIQTVYKCIYAVDLPASKEKTAQLDFPEAMPNLSKDKNFLLAPSNAALLFCNYCTLTNRQSIRDCRLLVILVEPLDEHFAVIIMSIYEACVSCILPENPL